MLVPRAVVAGFGTAVCVWVAWFVTHLPWVGMNEQVAVPTLLGVWVLGVAGTLWWTGGKKNPLTGLVAGAVCAVTGLLVLGSVLSRSEAPPVYLVVPGFLALGAVLGLAGGVIASLVAGPERAQVSRLSQFATVVAVAVTPLLVVGGLVTSTGSGMAFPDWPTSGGVNMLIYPLGPRSEPGKFLEHSHRLFGMLVGFSALVLVIWVAISERRRWVQVLAGITFGLVCLQGGLGGLRVLAGSAEAASDRPMWAVLHGVLAQLVFGCAVALAAALTPLFSSDVRVTPSPLHRRFKAFSTGLTHSLILQLLLGAVYRHMRHGHVLWTHIAFSIIVVLMAVMAGAVAMRIAREETSADGVKVTLRRLGIGLFAVVTLQFALGWAAFLAGGAARTAENPLEAIVRTAHQANGAVLIAFATLAFVWSRWLLRRGAAGR